MSLSSSLDSMSSSPQSLGEMAESRALVAVRAALAATDSRHTVWIALSGGLDSVMLARLAARAAQECPRRLRLVHVHHGLQAANDDFERLARRLASRLGLPLSVRHLALDEAAFKSRGVEAPQAPTLPFTEEAQRELEKMIAQNLATRQEIGYMIEYLDLSLHQKPQWRDVILAARKNAEDMAMKAWGHYMALSQLRAVTMPEGEA